MNIRALYLRSLYVIIYFGTRIIYLPKYKGVCMNNDLPKALMKEFVYFNNGFRFEKLNHQNTKLRPLEIFVLFNLQQKNN